MELWDIYDKDKKPTGRTMKKNDWCLKDGEYHLTVLGVIMRPDKKFLITQRVMTKAWAAGWWEVSGGAAMAGESSLEAVKREVKEETGVALTNWRFRGVVTFLTDGGWEGEYMYLFTADEWDGEFTSDCTEGNLEWVPKEEVPKLPIWEGDKIFLRLLAENAPPFLLTLEYAGDNLIRAELNGDKLI